MPRELAEIRKLLGDLRRVGQDSIAEQIETRLDQIELFMARNTLGAPPVDPPTASPDLHSELWFGELHRAAR